MMKMELPSLKENINQMANGMFILLRSRASPGAARGDNAELLIMLFKVGLFHIYLIQRAFLALSQTSPGVHVSAV